MKVMIIQIMIGAFGTVTKGLLNGPEDLAIGGRVDTNQTTAFLKMARILRRFLETWWNLLSLNSSERPSAYADMKNSKGMIIIEKTCWKSDAYEKPPDKTGGKILQKDAERGKEKQVICLLISTSSRREKLGEKTIATA